MKAVIFENESEMDPRAWSVMGLSAKVNDESIGVFGTGCKMALAVLLREKHSVQIFTGGKRYIFTARAEKFRDTDYEQIYCNNEPLPFTTNLGRNWQLWQAYRELHSNCLDEKGITREYDGREPFATGIIVTGDKFHDVFKNRDKYFLKREDRLAEGHNLKIHGGKGKFYYRGSLAGENFATIYNYDFHNGCTLTEDRTLAADWNLKWELARGVSQLRNKEIIKQILTAPSETIEHSLDWDSHFTTATQEFKEIAASLYEGKLGVVSDNLIRTIKKYAPQISVSVIEMDDEQKKMLKKAKKKLKKMGYEISHEIFMCEKQGATLAFAFENKIYLTSPCFVNTTLLQKALFEEWAHNQFNLKDCSREFQNYLIDQIFAQSRNKSEISSS